jgi:type III pantothenate kinase
VKIVAIDSGNSRIKWGVYENGQWLKRGVLATREAEGLSEALPQIIAPARVVAANVAGEAVRERIDGATASLELDVTWIVARDEQCGVRSSYADTATLGPDRWAALIAARHLHPGACIVVNAGTTLTADALSAEGIFAGGVIVPGYALMREALAAGTARLKTAEGRFAYFPDNTADAIASGALNALAGAVDRMSRYLADTGEGDPLVLLSGGDAALIEPLLSAPRLVDNLVLEGLARIGTEDA